MSRGIDEVEDLNLAPIMNVVMILIPLILVTAQFVNVNTLPVNSPRNAQSVTPETDPEEEESPLPRVMIAISEDGFRLSDMRQSPNFMNSNLASPIEGCGGSGPVEAGTIPVTVCNMADSEAGAPLVERLNWRGLYNILVRVRTHEDWSAQWDDQNCIMNVVADREIPFEAVVRTIDVARFFLDQDNYADEELFRAAKYREVEGQHQDLFPIPVLLLPRAASD